MRKQYSAEFKADVILEVLRGEKTLAQIASERGIHPAMIVRWAQDRDGGATRAVPAGGARRRGCAEGRV